MSRALCSFRRVTLANGSRNAVKATLLQAKREALSDTDIIKIEQDQGNRRMAGLWAWPKPDEQTGVKQDAVSRSIPETLAREPMQSGQRLANCLEGVEGQVWGDGSLIASRWWPGIPGQNQWVKFLRSARLKTDEISLAVPSAVDVPWRTNLPILQSVMDALRVFATPARLFLVVGVILAAMFVHSGVQYFRYHQTVNNLQAQITARKVIVSDILAERNKAVLNLRAIDQMAGLGTSTALLMAVAGVLENVQGKDMRITKLSLIDEQLSILVTGEPELKGAALVSRLEGVDALAQVSVNFKPRNEIEIKSQLAASENATLRQGQ